MQEHPEYPDNTLVHYTRNGGSLFFELSKQRATRWINRAKVGLLPSKRLALIVEDGRLQLWRADSHEPVQVATDVDDKTALLSVTPDCLFINVTFVSDTIAQSVFYPLDESMELGTVQSSIFSSIIILTQHGHW